MSMAITILAIVLALVLGVAVTRKAFRHRPLTQADIAALQADYRQARRSHRPSREIGRKLVHAVAEQIKQESAT